MEHKAFHQMIHRIVDAKKPFVTAFLSEEEQGIVLNITHGEDVILDGGFLNPSRKRAFFFTTPSDEIRCLKILSTSSYLRLSHPKVLGSLMALNISRDQIGDILPKEQVFFVTKEIFNTVNYQLTKIGKDPITLEISDGSSIEKTISLREFNIIVSSLRLDVVVAAILNLSRKKSEYFIKNNHVKVNHQLVTDIKKQVSLNDVLSLHRYGRFVILEDIKTTRKHKTVLKIGKYT